MLTLRELRTMAKKLPAREFRQQLGPFALVRRPPDPVIQEMAMRLAAGRTELPGKAKNKAFETALAFDDLLVLSLPPVGEQTTFSVGRLPDCDIVVDHPSVSKRHAALTWEEGVRRCSIKDLESRNGTTLNGGLVTGGEYVVSDNDLLGFGDESFWYLLAETLRVRLSGPAGGFRRL